MKSKDRQKTGEKYLQKHDKGRANSFNSLSTSKSIKNTYITKKKK